MADQLKKEPRAWGPETRFAFCRFTPAASPAVQTLLENRGFESVTRTGAGAWTAQLKDTKCKSIEAFATYYENDTTTRHQVRAESVDVSAGTIAVTHKAVAFASESSMVVVKAGRLADVAAASSADNQSYAVSPVAGTITRIQAHIVSGGPLNADAIITCDIGGTPITTGAITLPNTSAVDTVVAVVPTAAATVAVGSKLHGITDAGGSTSAAVDLQYTIQSTSGAPAASDTVDQIVLFVAYRVVD